VAGHDDYYAEPETTFFETSDTRRNGPEELCGVHHRSLELVNAGVLHVVAAHTVLTGSDYLNYDLVNFFNENGEEDFMSAASAVDTLGPDWQVSGVETRESEYN
jgi:hypothetical protein